MIAVVAIAAVGYWRWTEAPAAPETDVAPVLTPDTTTIVAPAETAAAAPAVVAPAPAPNEAPKPVLVDTVRPVAPVRAEPVIEQQPKPVAIDLARQRYAKTWANVRSERSSTAQVVQVLDRGEVVAIDSLVDGWYRVTTERPTVGYVDQQFLDTLPPSAP